MSIYVNINVEQELNVNEASKALYTIFWLLQLPAFFLGMFLVSTDINLLEAIGAMMIIFVITLAGIKVVFSLINLLGAIERVKDGDRYYSKGEARWVYRLDRFGAWLNSKKTK